MNGASVVASLSLTSPLITPSTGEAEPRGSSCVLYDTYNTFCTIHIRNIGRYEWGLLVLRHRGVVDSKIPGGELQYPLHSSRVVDSKILTLSDPLHSHSPFPRGKKLQYPLHSHTPRSLVVNSNIPYTHRGWWTPRSLHSQIPYTLTVHSQGGKNSNIPYTLTASKIPGGELQYPLHSHSPFPRKTAMI